ncbi:hypothetical protein ACFXKY_14890 [Streptomyces canus]|uniref:hypothetical protein n=1 Tax=Streptomyces canus TaxID=58343 RepID=UPI00367549A6
MTRKAVMALLVGCALAAGPVGCTSTQPVGSGPKPSVNAAMTDVATRSGRWPTGAGLLQAAFDHLDRTCLGKAGFHMPTLPRAPQPSPDNEAEVVNLSGREHYGYGIATPRDSSTGAQGANAYVSALSNKDKRRFIDAQFGPRAPRTAVNLHGKSTATVPAGGCVAAARRELAGNVQTWAKIDYIPQQLDDQVSRAAEQDPSYQAALDRWRACMTRRGYVYTSPEAAAKSMQDEHAQGATGSVFQHREIAVAVADGRCEIRTHLPSEVLRIRRQHVAQLATGDLLLLRSVTGDWESAVTRARSTLATHTRDHK